MLENTHVPWAGNACWILSLYKKVWTEQIADDDWYLMTGMKRKLFDGLGFTWALCDVNDVNVMNEWKNWALEHLYNLLQMNLLMTK